MSEKSQAIQNVLQKHANSIDRDLRAASSTRIEFVTLTLDSLPDAETKEHQLLTATNADSHERAVQIMEMFLNIYNQKKFTELNAKKIRE